MELNLRLMRLIDEEFMRHPFYGVRRMKAWLRTRGYAVNRKRVSRLDADDGSYGHLSEAAAVVQRVGPQGLSLSVERADDRRPDQAWCTDITYIRLAPRFRLSCRDYGLAQPVRVVLEALDDAGPGVLFGCRSASAADLEAGDFQHGPGIAVYERGVHRRLERHDIRVSMDGRGRVYDNIFIERLWRSVKYEEVYLPSLDFGTAASMMPMAAMMA